MVDGLPCIHMVPRCARPIVLPGRWQFRRNDGSGPLRCAGCIRTAFPSAARQSRSHAARHLQAGVFTEVGGTWRPIMQFLPIENESVSADSAYSRVRLRSQEARELRRDSLRRDLWLTWKTGTDPCLFVVYIGGPDGWMQIPKRRARSHPLGCEYDFGPRLKRAATHRLLQEHPVADSRLHAACPGSDKAPYRAFVLETPPVPPSASSAKRPASTTFAPWTG
jgi:hypothetical protein